VADAIEGPSSILYLVDKIQVSRVVSRRSEPGSRLAGQTLDAPPEVVASPGFRLPRVLPRNLSEEIYEILRSAILSQEIEPGVRLLEAELASQLGVSRAPVREAMRMLEHEGLLESLPRRGATVVTLPEDEIQLIYELRAAIEGEAFARAAVRITDAELADLRGRLADLHAAYRSGDVEAVTTADREFHGAVLSVSRLTLLRRVWANFDGPLRLRIHQLTDAAPNPDTAFIESREYSHARLVEALEARDPVEAARLVRGHILEVKELVAEAQAGRATA
jgi:DNA-binding GntR family transcriptional regulator